MSLLLPRIKRLTIVTDRGIMSRFRPNSAQLYLLDDFETQMRDRGRARQIILKARQIGFSTMIESIIYETCWLFNDYRSLIMAHDRDTAANLLAMSKLYWERDPFKSLFSLRTDSKADLEWNETRSRLKVATAGNRQTGRGTTQRAIHMSEAGFYPDPVQTMNALKNAIHPVPSTYLAIESTANGIGNNFHTEWEKAVSHETDYTALFFPWHGHAAYCASAIGLPVHVTSYDEEERVLRRAFNLSDDQLQWRRWKIADNGGDLLQFHQEFPADPEEAFLSTGTNVFPGDHLQSCYDPQAGYRGLLVERPTGIEFVPSADGDLIIYKAPRPGAEQNEYIVAGDPTHTTFGDYAVAQVINRYTLEQVAVMRLRCDATAFGKHLYRLGEYYKWAIVAPESTGPGATSIGMLQGMAYPNIYLRQSKLDNTPGHLTGQQWGWATSLQTKHIAIGFLINVVVNSQLRLHDPKTYSEMRNYVTLANGQYGNGNGESHDDTVMAMAIGVACHFTDAPPLLQGSSRVGRNLQPAGYQTEDGQLLLGDGSGVKAGDFAERAGLEMGAVAKIPGLQQDEYNDVDQYDDEGDDW